MLEYNKMVQTWLTLMMLKKKNIKEHNPNWPQILDHSYKILIIGSSGSEKKIFFFNLMNQWADINKMYLYVKDLYEVKYQF